MFYRLEPVILSLQSPPPLFRLSLRHLPRLLPPKVRFFVFIKLWRRDVHAESVDIFGIQWRRAIPVLSFQTPCDDFLRRFPFVCINAVFGATRRRVCVCHGEMQTLALGKVPPVSRLLAQWASVTKRRSGVGEVSLVDMSFANCLPDDGQLHPAKSARSQLIWSSTDPPSVASPMGSGDF